MYLLKNKDSETPKQCSDLGFTSSSEGELNDLWVNELNNKVTVPTHIGQSLAPYINIL